MELKDRLKKIILDADLTQEVFALKAGISFDRVKNIAAGKVQKFDGQELLQIRNTFKVRESWLKNELGDPYLSDEEQALLPSLVAIESASVAVDDLDLMPKHKRKLQEIITLWKMKDTRALSASLEELVNADFVLIPKHAVAASAGGGSIISDELVVDHLAFKREWIKQSLGLDPNKLALIDVHGDSMSPTIEDGDLILIDTRPVTSKNEGVYAINFNGALLVKRLRMRLSGVVEVVSDNPHYGSEMLSIEELDRLIIVGRVVWHGGKFKAY